jgi:antitoxin HicB
MTSSVVRESFDMSVLHYAVLLEPWASSEGNGFTVSVPALPEIVTEGENLQHALDMAREAIELSLAARLDLREEIPVSESGTRLEVVSVANPTVQN